METDKMGETAKVVEITDSSGKVVEIEHEMENLD